MSKASAKLKELEGRKAKYNPFYSAASFKNFVSRITKTVFKKPVKNTRKKMIRKKI